MAQWDSNWQVPDPPGRTFFDDGLTRLYLASHETYLWSMCLGIASVMAGIYDNIGLRIVLGIFLVVSAVLFEVATYRLWRRQRTWAGHVETSWGHLRSGYPSVLRTAWLAVGVRRSMATVMAYASLATFVVLALVMMGLFISTDGSYPLDSLELTQPPHSGPSPPQTPGCAPCRSPTGPSVAFGSCFAATEQRRRVATGRHYVRMADRNPNWLTFLGLTRNPGQRPSFSMRNALLSLLVMTLVTVGVRLAFQSWTNIGEMWALAASVGIGYVASMLIVGGPFVPRD